MRSTSRGHRSLAILLCGILALDWTVVSARSFAETSPEPCLLLKYSSHTVSESMAKEMLEPMPGLMLRSLRVLWVKPQPVPPPQAGAELFPEADDASLERISGKIADALLRMDRMETREASTLLSEAETEVRKFRMGKTTRPYLSEIFLRRGVLSLWEGNLGGAEEMFARSRLLRPGFSPDPGLFSPRFRESWDRAAKRKIPEAELLVQYLPPGATVHLDGEPVGVTPGRFKVKSHEPVRVRISFPGYRDMEKSGQWLPGDSEAIEGILVRDRVSTLGDILGSSPDVKGSGGLLAELAAGAGASRVALLLLGEWNGKTSMRVFSYRPGEPEPSLLGEFELPTGEGASENAANNASRMLRKAGWPAANVAQLEGESPWYYKWWVWMLLGAAIASGAAAGGGNGGGGGGSGSSTGTIGVTF